MEKLFLDKKGSIKIASKAYLIIREKSNFSVSQINKIVSIGRDPKNDFILSSKGISRRHATIYLKDKCYFIVDGDLKGNVSTNGLWVNGIKISVHQLDNYDFISFQKGVEAFFIMPEECLSTGKMLELFFKKSFLFASGKTIRSSFLNGSEDRELKSQSTLVPDPKNSMLDGLTYLPNRSNFFSRVERALLFKEQIDQQYIFAVLLIDLDRFKIINDSLGHLVGDELLVNIAERLSTCIREGDMACRLGGDEFGVLLSDLNSLDEAKLITQRIQRSLSKPLQIQSHEIYPSLSIGIASSNLGYKTVEGIVRDADTAMHYAKSNGKSKFIVFNEKIHRTATNLFQLDNDLRKVIKQDGLQIFYQPIVSLKDKNLTGFEALLRWKHSDKGFISPSVFIPIAEENGLIHQVGDWLIDAVCQQLASWNNSSNIKNSLAVNINISPKQLMDSSIVKRLLDNTRKYNLDPAKIKLEIIESILMESTEQTKKVFIQLKEAGFQLAIDDFGVGYSSLSYLNRLPIDTLKIDKSFVKKIGGDGETTSINVTHSIIALAHSIGIKVVAEGIENLYQLAWLRQQKCDYGQGYLLSKPIDANEASRLAEKGLDWTWKC